MKIYNVILMMIIAISANSFAVELVGKPVGGASAVSAVETSEMVNAEAATTAAQAAIKDAFLPRDDIKQGIESITQDLLQDHSLSEHDEALWIPIIAIIFIFGGPIAVVITILILHYRAKTKRQEAINRNIDKLLAAGRDIPIELLRGDDGTVENEYLNLHKGLRYIGLGLGVLIFLTVLCGFHIGAIGFILIGLGASRVLIWWIARQNTAKTQGQE